MALTDDERERCRYHLGYLNTSTAASIHLGIPAASQPLFLLESAMNLLLPSGELRVRSLLAKLDSTEQRIFEAQERLAARKVGEIDLNRDECEQLEGEYRRWQLRLARQFGVSPNPFDPSGRGGGINVPVAGV